MLQVWGRSLYHQEGPMREFLLETLEYDIDVANTLRDRLRNAEGAGNALRLP
jgi:hypothetical protein